MSSGEATQVKPEWDSRFKLMPWWQSDVVKNATVMVVGAGALGNEVLKNLALLGVGKIIIVDFDTVEYSNLSRSVLFRPNDAFDKRQKARVASDRIKEINENIKTLVINGDISIDVGLGMFRRCDVIIGCLDNVAARVAINRLAQKANKIWVDAALDGLAGYCTVYQPGVSCYYSGLSKEDRDNMERQQSCSDVARRDVAMGRIPTTPVSSSIMAAMQVQEAIKVVHHNFEKLMAGRKFYYDGMNNQTYWFTTPPVNPALAELPYSPITPVNISCHESIETALTKLEHHFGTKDINIELDYNVISQITDMMRPENSHKVLIPSPRYSDKYRIKYKITPGAEIHIKSVVNIHDGFEDKKILLKHLGISPLHILRVMVDGNLQFIELSGDESAFTFN